MTDAADQREDIAAPANTAAAQTSAPADALPGGDFDNVLAEFEVGTAAKPATDFFAEPSPQNVDALLDGPSAVEHVNQLEALRGSGLAAELRAAELEQRGSRLEEIVSELQQREWHRQEVQDYSALIRESQDGIRDLTHLPADLPDRWWKAESVNDKKWACVGTTGTIPH